MSKVVKSVAAPFTDLLGLKPPTIPESVSSVAPPAVESPPPMPTPNSEATQQARRKSITAQMRRRGRSSTILSEETLG